MTLAQRNAEAVQGFIQSQVVVTIPGQQEFRLPPVVWVSLAGDIAAMVKTDFPSASISIQGRCRESLAGLDDALRVSNEVHAALEECQRQPHPGAALVKHFKAAACVGGV
ncbi:hypothetical protein CHR29_03725 [Pseudomonas monteilii]|uniref:hypothetical protein n=1 Tax=Pseudomonas monteilii TaxID=76759 RepID=UPI000EF644EE|nr:hypothetical protein [Pseudomonas monteilii]AYN14294.1 hypothetical protein CHR29_03725 [Pseudomonas monteilii]